MAPRLVGLVIGALVAILLARQRRRREEPDLPPEPSVEPLPRHPTYPSGLGPIWMASDRELWRIINRMAPTRQAQGDLIGYYIAEWDRRVLRRATRTTTRLTWVIAVLTVVLAVDALSS